MHRDLGTRIELETNVKLWQKTEIKISHSEIKLCSKNNVAISISTLNFVMEIKLKVTHQKTNIHKNKKLFCRNVSTCIFITL